MGAFPFPSKSYPFLEQSVLLSRDPQLHCFNTGCTQKPLASENWCQTGIVALSRTMHGLPDSPPVSGAMRGLKRCPVRERLHITAKTAEAPGIWLFLWTDKTNICVALRNGTRPKASPKYWSNDGQNCFPSFSLLKLSQSCMFQQMLPCVGWNMLVEHNYVYLNSGMYREALQGLHTSKINTVCSQLYPGNLQAGSGGGSPTLGQLTCWHACPCQGFFCHRTFLCSELLGKNLGFWIL